MDRSLRRLGQLLVVMGALLGAVLGVGLALLVENTEPDKAVAAPDRERVAVLTASPSSSQPPASEATGSPDSGGSVSSANQRTQSADQRADKANKNSQGRRDKPEKAKGKDNQARARTGNRTSSSGGECARFVVCAVHYRDNRAPVRVRSPHLDRVIFADHQSWNSGRPPARYVVADPPAARSSRGAGSTPRVPPSERRWREGGHRVAEGTRRRGLGRERPLRRCNRPNRQLGSERPPPDYPCW